MHLTSNSSISRRAFLAGTGVMAFGLSGCSQTGNTAKQLNQQPNEQAGSTSQRTDAEKVPESSNNATSDDEGLVDGKLAVFDLHSDTLGRREMQDSECWQNFLVSIGFDPSSEAGDLRQNKGALDLTRMQQLSYFQCFGIWMDTDEPEAALAYYRKARNRFTYDIEQNNSDIAVLARPGGGKTAMQVAMEAVRGGKVAALLSIENASMIGDDLGVVDEMISDGIVMSSLTWGGKNSLGSSPSTTDGLTAMGKQVVRKFEEGDIVVDVSHLNDEGFNDLLSIRKRPFVASHSNSRAVCNVPRNLTDDMFRALVDMGGLAGLNLYRSYITERPAPSSGEVTFDELSAHVDHWLALGGEDVIAIGTDYDGSDVPEWIGSCSQMPDLNVRLAERFGRDVVNKMFFRNAYGFLADMSRECKLLFKA